VIGVTAYSLANVEKNQQLIDTLVEEAGELQFETDAPEYRRIGRGSMENPRSAGVS